MAYERELDVAIQAVRKACRLCSGVQYSLLHDDTTSKDDRSPVTVADLGSQAVITSELLRSFPEDSIVSEEDANVLRDNEYIARRVLGLVNEQIGGMAASQLLEALDYGARTTYRTIRFWTVDPIDGTKGFLRGEQYAIALALVEGGKVMLGVLGCPNLPWTDGGSEENRGGVYFAVKGQGAFVQTMDQSVERSISVDSLALSAEARFCESVEEGHVSHENHARISSILGITTPPYRIDSQCKYAVVARGDASIYLRLSSKKDYRDAIWDHAAGSIIVMEAGGQVTDSRGEPLDFAAGRRLANNSGIVATNGKLHQQVIAAIAQAV
ncbi:MAG: 3'(2'),5'-bisphosphate nucleotidase [Dehalococcoidia bacterium]|nr:MAG: 3'(2'),5'-bisphosphate nucleotidase [Dehalococcoidia bacterium]